MLQREIAKEMTTHEGMRELSDKYEAELRSTHEATARTLEKQRRELESNFLARTKQLDAEIVQRRFQCTKECEAIIAAQQAKTEVVLSALEKLGPEELLAQSEAENLTLRGEIVALREQLEKHQPALMTDQQREEGMVHSLSAFFNFKEGDAYRSQSEPVCKPDEPIASPAVVMRQLQLKKQQQELEAAKQKAVQAEDFIRADELKEEIRKLNTKMDSWAPTKPLVTITTLRVKQEYITNFTSSWQEPPRTRLLQSHQDKAEFIMYEAHPSEADMQAIIDTPDEIKWGDVAGWLEEPSKTECFDAVHML